jgi:hypothetical protein
VVIIMDNAEKMELLVNIRDIKSDLYALKEYTDSLNSQKMGKPGTTRLNEIELDTAYNTLADDQEIDRLRSARTAGKRKASSKKRKSKKRKSKTRRRR